MCWLTPIISRANQPTSTVYDSQNTTFFQYSFGWDVTNVNTIPSMESPRPFMQTTDPVSYVVFSVSNSTSVALYASLDYGHGPYQVVSYNNSILAGARN